MKRNLLFNSVYVLCLLLIGNKAFSQDASMGYDYVGAANYPTVWSTSATTFNAGTAREIIFKNDGGANIKSAAVASVNSVSHYELGSNAFYIEIDLTSNSTASYFTVEFTGSSNSTTANACKGGVVYSDKMPFDEASVIGAEETAYFPASNGAFSKMKINPPTGTKSLRMYRRIYYGTGSISTSSGSGRVQYGLGQTIRLASMTAYQAPLTQASNISFTSVTGNSMTVNWTNGSGSSRAIFVKENAGVITNPIDGTTYTASTDWSAKGTQLGTSGYYCVYNGTGTSVTLTNLDLSKSYTVQIFEFNGSGTGSVFLTTTATDNPKIQAGTLPVKLTSFKASSQTDGIGLTWTTASEKNTAKFIVERVAANGSSTTVAEIAAAVNSNNSINYAAKDKNVTAGETYYYRLKTVDKDGAIQTSDLVSAKFGLANSNSLTIFPNPASNQVTINFQKSENASKLIIVDSKGAIVLKMDITADVAEQTVDVSSLKTGVYLVQIQSNKGRVSSKFFKN